MNLKKSLHAADAVDSPEVLRILHVVKSSDTRITSEVACRSRCVHASISAGTCVHKNSDADAYFNVYGACLSRTGSNSCYPLFGLPADYFPSHPLFLSSPTPPPIRLRLSSKTNAVNKEFSKPPATRLPRGEGCGHPVPADDGNLHHRWSQALHGGRGFSGCDRWPNLLQVSGT